MNTNQKCPQCGAPLDGNAGGVCPKCLLQQALANSDASPYEATVIQEPAGSPTEGNTDVPPASIRYFGDYEILKEIARGGMGIVYKARQVSLNRIVAVKVILSGELASETEVKRFYKEAEAAANLQHPNIVAIHEVGEQGRHYFSMDYVEGADLGQHLRQGPMDPRHAAAVLKKVTEAVAYAHMQGTLHRDLKPSNILLDGNGEPRVTDFGLAKRSADREGATLSGTVLGTPAYMAPEQAAGRLDKIDGRTDVYGLGAVLFAMLTGKAPFTGETALAVMREVTDRPPTPPSKVNPSVPVELEIICLKCLEKNPENRYASAIDLAADLNRFLHGQPILAKPASRLMNAMDHLRQNPWMVTAALSFLVLFLLLGSYGLWDYAQLSIWKAHHPGQKPVLVAPVPFLHLLGLPEFLLAWILVAVFAYMVVGPPGHYANFAELKRKGRLTARDLKFFAGVALGNVVVAFFAMCWAAHYWIWNDLKDGKDLFIVLLLVSPFWFGAHILWLVVIEWRGFHFGEKAEDVRAVYGVAPNATPKRQQPSPAPGLALIAVFFITTDLLGVPKFIFGFAWGLLMFFASIYHHRQAILAWKRGSRVANQLFWFIAIPSAVFGLGTLTSPFKLALGTPVRGFACLLMGVVAGSAVIRWGAILDKQPRPPRFWNVSSFGRWMAESEWAQVTNQFAILALAWWSHSPAWALGLALAGKAAKDALEFALTPDRSRRKELGIELGLALSILSWLFGYSRPPAFGLAIAVGLLVGWIEATIAIGTLSRAARPLRKWMALWLAELGALAAAAILFFPGMASLRLIIASLPELNKIRWGLDLEPEGLGYTGDSLVEMYAKTSLIGDGIHYFERMTSRFPQNSPGAFKAQWAMAELLRAGSKPAEAPAVHSRLANNFHLVPARHWFLAGPFAAATAPEPSEIASSPSSWKSAESAGVVFSGYLDLMRMLRSGPTNLAKPVIYGRLRIVSPVDQEVSLRLGLTGEATGWLNNREILRARQKAIFNLDNATVVRATLLKGENTLLLRMAPETEFPGLIVRFLDPKGNAVSNLQFGQ